MTRWILPFTVGIAISVLTAYAHHSISGAYDTGRKVTIEGTVTEFHFVNPHPFVTMQVTQGSGPPQPWRIEMDNRSELIQIGVTSATLKPGDRVIVIGSPARTQPQSLYVQKLDRPADGFSYEQVGGSPRIRTRR